jgi:hypothetical protein
VARQYTNGSCEAIVADLNCTVFESIPDGFLDCPAERLAELLPGPFLLDLPGRERRPLCVSVLLHGNEDTGLAAAQQVLRRYLTRELHRSMLLFVGNIAAAAANVRTLPDQADHNQNWPGTPTPDIPEALMARWVYDHAAAVDRSRASTSTTILGSIRITPASRSLSHNLSPWRTSFLEPLRISRGR